jgi:TolA-binding protein
MRLPTLLAACALLPLPAAGCVSSARHRAAAAEVERLRRENLELRRDLAEQRVRLQESLEALRSAPPSSKRQTPGTPSDGDRVGITTSPGLSRSAAATKLPELPEIDEEEIRDPEPRLAAAGETGERILWVARRYRDEGRLQASIDAYGRFIRDFPFSPLLPEALVERGRTRLKTGDRRGALDDFRTVVEAFPSSRLAPEASREVARLVGP